MNRQFDVQIPISAKNLTSAAVAGVESGLTKLEQKLKNLRSIGEGFKTTGREMMFVGGAMAGLAAVGVKKSMDFEFEMAKVAALTNQTVSQAVDQYGGAIMAMSKNTGKSTSDLNEALRLAISSGIEAGDALRFLDVSSRAAVGGFAQTATMVEGLGRLYNAYGRDISQVNKMAGQLFLTDKYGVTTMEAVASNVGTLAGQFAAVGVQSGDFLAALASLTKFAPSTEEAVTQLQASLTAILTPTPEVERAIYRLNMGLKETDRISFGLKALQKDGLVGWFQKLQRATKGNTQAMIDLFGSEIRAFKGMNSLMLDSKEFVRISKEMNNELITGTIVQDKMNMVNQTATQRYELMKARIELLRKSFGDALIPSITKYGNVAGDKLENISKWINTNQADFQSYVKTLGIVSVALIGAGGVSFALGQTITLISRLSLAVKGLRVAMTMLAGHPLIAGLLAVGGIAYFAYKQISKIQNIGQGTHASDAANLSALNTAANQASKIQSPMAGSALNHVYTLSPDMKPEKGFVSKQLNSAPKSVDQSKNIHIKELHLENIQDADSLISQLDDYSTQLGLAY